MNAADLFVNLRDVPQPLSKSEVNILLRDAKEGDEKSRELLITHNIRLVFKEVCKNFEMVDYDLKELVSVGIIGLIKAVDSFDESKNCNLSTYATVCIHNEILMFLRKIKRYQDVVSFDAPIEVDDDAGEIYLKDCIRDDMDLENECVENDIKTRIRKIVNDLPEREQEIVYLYFGFYNGRRFNQREVAKIIGVSQARISEIIKSILVRLRKSFEENGLTDLVNTKDKKINL